MGASRQALATIILLLLFSLGAVNITALGFEPQADPPAIVATAAAPTPLATATAKPTFTPTATVTASPTVTPTIRTTLTATPTSTVTLAPKPTLASELPREAHTGKAVVIDQAIQMMRVYEDGLLIRIIPVSTGKPGPHTTTPAWEGRIGYYVGTFSSFGTTQDEGWFLFPNEGNILIHGAPYLIENGEKVYQELEALGKYPASHGCVRLPPDEARWFTQWGPEGAYCLITPLPEEKFQ